VIKTVAYFPSQAARNSGPVLDAVISALNRAGIRTQENHRDSDAAIIWSVLWHGRMAANREIYEHYRSLDRPVIVIDIGALYRGNTWKIAVNHVNRLGYYGHEQDLDWDRPLKLQISLATPVGIKPHVCIAAQHDRSLQVVGLPSQSQWVLDRVRELRLYTDRPIVIRPHPRSRLTIPRLPPGVIMEQPRPVANTYDSFDMHFDCHAVVNHCSGPGIQAAIAGCRPIVDASSLAAPVAVNMANIEQPYDCDRDRWLVEICHTEYTLEEIRKGLWLKRIEPALTR